MLFCPNCANLLVISAETGYNKWACNTCAYEFPITKQVRRIGLRLCNYRDHGIDRLDERDADDFTYKTQAETG